MAKRGTLVNVVQESEYLVQLATRVPRDLLRAVKLTSVAAGTTIQATVVAALREHLRRAAP